MPAPNLDDRARSRLNLAGGKDRVALVAALGLLSAVSPMATDMYLASMPHPAGHFGTSASAVQLTLGPPTWWAWPWGRSCWVRSPT